MMQIKAEDVVETGPRAAGVSAAGRRWILLTPFVGFLGFGVLSYWILGRDVHLVRSPLIGKPVPTFNLPPVQARSLGLSSNDLKGDVSTLNGIRI